MRSAAGTSTSTASAFEAHVLINISDEVDVLLRQVLSGGFAPYWIVAFPVAFTGSPVFTALRPPEDFNEQIDGRRILPAADVSLNPAVVPQPAHCSVAFSLVHSVRCAASSRNVICVQGLSLFLL